MLHKRTNKKKQRLIEACPDRFYFLVFIAATAVIVVVFIAFIIAYTQTNIIIIVITISFESLKLPWHMNASSLLTTHTKKKTQKNYLASLLYSVVCINTQV